MTSCRFSRWRISAILDCRDPIMGSLKSQCRTSYRSLIETIALNCLVFEKIAFFCILATDRQTDGQTDGQLRCVKPQSRYRELRLNKVIHKYNTRQKDDFYIDAISQIGKRSIEYKGSKLWNDLPAEEMQSLQSFKYKLKNYLLQSLTC